MRGELLVGHTHQVKASMPDGVETTFYITINFHPDDLLKPCEVFVNVRDSKYWEHLTVATVFISRLLQAGVPVSTIVEDLKQIHSPVTGHMQKGEGWCPSIYARIGQLLELEYPYDKTPKIKPVDA